MSSCQDALFPDRDCPRHGQLARSCSECEHEKELSDAACEKVVAQRWARRWKTRAREAIVALRKIYEYRSDKPDWNMVMAIAGDVVEPMVAVLSGKADEEP